MRNCNKNVNITLHEIIDEIQLGESTVEIRNAIEIIKFILGFIPVINCITDIYQLVDDVTQALSDDGKISGGEWLALGADVIFLGLDVVAAGSQLHQTLLLSNTIYAALSIDTFPFVFLPIV